MKIINEEKLQKKTPLKVMRKNIKDNMKLAKK